MSDNPFLEPGDDDRTVIIPIPGGRRPAAPASAPPRSPNPPPLPPAATPRSPAPPPTPPASAPRSPAPPQAPPAAAPRSPAPPQAPPAASPAPAEPGGIPAVGVSPLTEAASPLLQLLAGLRTWHSAPDLRSLRERALSGLRALERDGQERGIAADLLRPAHYVLCASIDDLVLTTPWGAASGWAKQTLLAAFHPDAGGSDKVFDLLRNMQAAPARFGPVIELIYLCLSLGFMGRYREARGDGAFEQPRTEAHATIQAQRTAGPTDLSPRWRGAALPYRPGRRGVPVWVGLAGAAALCGGLAFWTSISLNAASDRLLTSALAMPPARMPRIARSAVVLPLAPPPAPAGATLADRLRASLAPDIEQGAISLLGTPAAPIIRVIGHAMFRPASAVVQADALPLLDRLATALRAENVSLRVLDYTDSQPIRTVQFPSNFQLSAARADAVRAAMLHGFGDPSRISAEGRADADPVAPNTTADGREQNRRIEIVVRPRD